MCRPEYAPSHNTQNTRPVIIHPQIKIDRHPSFHSQPDQPDSRQWSFTQDRSESYIEKFMLVKHSLQDFGHQGDSESSLRDSVNQIYHKMLQK